MRALIRCDIGGEHGMGHASRCLALAKALDMRSVEPIFVTATPALKEFVAPFVCNRPVIHRGDVLLVDHKQAYHDPSLLADTHTCGGRLVRLDDPSATPTNCDLLIGPCAHWEPETVSRFRTDFGPRFLYGFDYIILDESVTSQPAILYAERIDDTIVFCAGGSDPAQALRQMLIWSEHLLPDVRKVFCVGAYTSNGLSEYVSTHTVDDVLSNNRIIIPFHRDALRHAALVVGMFGQTAYECLYWQTPMLYMSHTAENWHGSRALMHSTNGAVHALGHCDTEYGAAFQSCVSNFWQASTTRRMMHDAASGLIDGQGAARVAEAIVNLA